jgi:hypothetical protein
VGLQDRLAKGFSRKRSLHPAVHREIPVDNPRSEVVGSGLIRGRRVLEVDHNQPQEPIRAARDAASDAHIDTVLEMNLESGRSVEPVNAQETESGSRPVRHAFVQDQYLRDLSPRGVVPPQEEEPFNQEFEWADEQPAQVQTLKSNPVDPRQESIPARPVSVLRRQDGERQDSDFQAQPGTQQDQSKSDFQKEVDRLDQQFEQRRNEQQNQSDPSLDLSDRPQSLLETNEGSEADSQDGENEQDRDDKAKTSLLDRSCAEFQADLLNTSIRDIALDISPPAINTNQPYMGISRSWTDRNGQIIATGTLTDLRRGYVFLDNGQKISFARLSEADLAAVSEHWNLPKSCLVGSRGSIERCWHPQTYHWTASSLCHKPLYFENIQLERYGHTHGPIMQPIRSVAHFFVSLATLPYQSAIHPANECEYPLGLYRPGDCAPWLKDPIPISLDGLRRQGLVTTGLAFIP